jgi:hypothetical protein
MPKKMVAHRVDAEGRSGVTTLPTWQVTGLSLAVIVGHVFNGLGALVFGLLSVGVIWTLHRLHTHAPGSRTTADLISSASGAAPAPAVAVIQFVAYVLIGAYTAKSIASMALVWLPGPGTTVPGWTGPGLAVAVAALGALLVGSLPTRLLAPAVTVLAAFALLVFFYVALAVVRAHHGVRCHSSGGRVGPCGTSDFTRDCLRRIRDTNHRRRPTQIRPPATRRRDGARNLVRRAGVGGHQPRLYRQISL